VERNRSCSKRLVETTHCFEPASAPSTLLDVPCTTGRLARAIASVLLLNEVEDVVDEFDWEGSEVHGGRGETRVLDVSRVLVMLVRFSTRLVCVVELQSEKLEEEREREEVVLLD
jgi:hypothetical protein